MKLKTSYQRLSSKDKFLIINEFLNGKSVSKISREYGISRTIFYKWLKIYSSENLDDSSNPIKEQKVNSHWRKLSRPKEKRVVTIAISNSNYSIRRIAKEAEVSVGSVWKILKEHSLTP